MSGDRLRGWRLLGVLVAIQVVVCLGFGLERLIRPAAPEEPFRWEALDEPAPEVRFERPGLEATEVSRGRVIVHFWATWCAPCRVELPVLLAAAERDGVRLIAATEEEWFVVERYFGGEVPPAVRRDPAGAAREAYAVSGLPDTFVVVDGRVVARAGGPRDWSSPSGRAFLTGR